MTELYLSILRRTQKYPKQHLSQESHVICLDCLDLFGSCFAPFPAMMQGDQFGGFAELQSQWPGWCGFAKRMAREMVWELRRCSKVSKGIQRVSHL